MFVPRREPGNPRDMFSDGQIDKVGRLTRHQPLYQACLQGGEHLMRAVAAERKVVDAVAARGLESNQIRKGLVVVDAFAERDGITEEHDAAGDRRVLYRWRYPQAIGADRVGDIVEHLIAVELARRHTAVGIGCIAERVVSMRKTLSDRSCHTRPVTATLLQAEIAFKQRQRDAYAGHIDQYQFR